MSEHDADAVVEIVLEPERFDAFVAGLDNPPPASAKLKALMRGNSPWASTTTEPRGQHADDH